MSPLVLAIAVVKVKVCGPGSAQRIVKVSSRVRCSSSFSAGVCGRGEYLNANAAEKPPRGAS